jgi:hypothetical protein
MNAIELTDFLTRNVKEFLHMLLNLARLINPANIESIFRNLKPKSVNALRVYAVLLIIPLFFGYFLFFNVFQEQQYSGENSFKLALRNYLIVLVIVLSVPYVFYLFDLRLVGRKVTYAEALTIFIYTLGDGILGGFFRISNYTWVLHLLLIVYTIYLLYAGLGARFGYEKAMLPFLFLILLCVFIGTVLVQVLNLLLMVPYGYTGF